MHRFPSACLSVNFKVVLDSDARFRPMCDSDSDSYSIAFITFRAGEKSTDIGIHSDRGYLDTLEQPCRTTLSGLIHDVNCSERSTDPHE